MNLTKESLMPYLQNESGVLNIERIAEELMADWPLSPAQRRKRLIAKLNQIPGCFRGNEHNYVYLPRFRTGAKILQPFPQDHSSEEELAPVIWLPELAALWNPNFPQTLPVVCELTDGTREEVQWHPYGRISAMSPGLNRWLKRVADEGANAVEVTCVDGEQNLYSVKPTTLDACDRSEANKIIRTAAHDILTHHRRAIHVMELAAELLARGMYHTQCAPLPVIYTLFLPPVLVQYRWNEVAPMPKLPRVLGELMQQRQREVEMDSQMFSWGGGFWRDSGGMLMPEMPPPTPIEPFRGNYRLVMTLDHHRVSRTVDISAGATFYDLHCLIQSLFDWDNDHLWVFSFSRRPGDPTASIGPDEVDDLLASAYDLTLGEILEQGQTFHYVFDFGDWWVVTIRAKTLMRGTIARDPVIVERKGEAPPQYPDFEDDY